MPDLKLGNIMSGLMNHASSHPCTWYDVPSDSLNLCGNYRTINDCIKNYEDWVLSGADKKNLSFIKIA